MIRMKLSIVALCLLSSHAVGQDGTAVSEGYNAETMLNLCTGAASGAAETQSIICTFRLQGVADMMMYNCLSHAQGFEPAPQLTASPLGSRGAIRQVFVNYMQANPTVWGEHWAGVVAAALAETFPCEE